MHDTTVAMETLSREEDRNKAQGSTIVVAYVLRLAVHVITDVLQKKKAGTYTIEHRFSNSLVSQHLPSRLDICI